MYLIQILFLFLFLNNICLSQDVTEYYLYNRTPQWSEVIEYYKKLDKQFTQAKLFTEGTTDIGMPLHLFVISSDGDFNPESLHQKKKLIWLINNGIHPGEPDGIDASMIFAKDVLNKINSEEYKNVVICIIPIYNIDGSLNRGCCSRVNQDGPQEYGFRGNYQNLDLNRDFVKCDTKNTESFIRIFQKWNPDLFLDTHVSNGADYPYNITLIATQKDKLTPPLGKYLSEKMLPELYRKMESKSEKMIPYVNTIKDTPDSGLEGFLETPRYASGYTALFNTIGFISETHMLKPYPIRVKATITFMETLRQYAAHNVSDILKKRDEAVKFTRTTTEFPVQWQLDTLSKDSIRFDGYTAVYSTSKITGLQRLSYNKDKPYSKFIPYKNNFKPQVIVNRPVAYIIPQCWTRVLERMKLNGVKMQTITSDTVIEVECYKITQYKTSSKPYEGHYLHSNVTVEKQIRKVKFYQGDRMIVVNQPANRYVVETLEPQGADAFFVWGFFDGILQQKEWFSDYVFEDIAEKMILENPALMDSLKAAIKADSSLQNNQYMQLNVLYRQSPYFEKSYMIYPVYRLMQ